MPFGEILIVQDNRDDAMLLIRALRENNIANRLIHLSDGDEALNFIFAEKKFSDRKVENTPRAVLLDLKLPKIGGLDVLKAIRNDNRTSSIPVIVMTSSKEECEAFEVKSLGICGCLVKPIAFSNLTKAAIKLGMTWLLVNRKVD